MTKFNYLKYFFGEVVEIPSENRDLYEEDLRIFFKLESYNIGLMIINVYNSFITVELDNILYMTTFKKVGYTFKSKLKKSFIIEKRGNYYSLKNKF
jgi:hypothetical protein